MNQRHKLQQSLEIKGIFSHSKCPSVPFTLFKGMLICSPSLPLFFCFVFFLSELQQLLLLPPFVCIFMPVYLAECVFVSNPVQTVIDSFPARVTDSSWLERSPLKTCRKNNSSQKENKTVKIRVSSIQVRAWFDCLT